MNNSENIRTCIILCGGKSSRMGEDKGSMIINREPMIIHILDALSNNIDEVIIVLNDSYRISRYKEMINYEYDYNINFVEDEIKDKGPMSGIMTGLKNIKSSYGLVIPCDSPYISEEFVINSFNIINKLEKDELGCMIPFSMKTSSIIETGNDPNTSNSKITGKEELTSNITNTGKEEDNFDYDFKLKNSQPLHGIYNKNCVSIISELLESDNRSMKSLINKANSYFIKEEKLDKSEISFKNINTKKDLEDLKD
ncbi:MAG: molybdenum cofactor guanylyltransferase [Methanobacteriaceae archaeon]